MTKDKLMSDYENDTRYRAAYLAALLARHYPDAKPHVIGRVVYEMQAAARAAKGWETKRCNVPMSERQEDAGRKRIDKMESTVNDDLAKLPRWSDENNGKPDAPCTITLGGDPRGPCARLHVPDESGDGFGDGFAVY